jgi:hypothetical protein
MLLMIEVSNAYNGKDTCGDGAAGVGFVDVRGGKLAPIQRNLVNLLMAARPLKDTATQGKAPSLYEVLPLEVRAAQGRYRDRSQAVLPREDKDAQQRADQDDAGERAARLLRQEEK